MRPLLFVGAGGFTRETIEVVRQLNAEGDAWTPLGVLDDDPALAGVVVDGLRVLGPVSAGIEAEPDAAVVIGVGSPRNFVARAQIVDRLGLDESRYATLVHPSSVIGSRVAVGAGTVVHAGSVFTTELSVGRHVAVMPGVVLTHDDSVEDFATLGAGVRVGGGAKIGRGAYVGSGAIVRDGVRVGPWALVGAGAVVLQDVPPGEVWVGNPARRLRDVELPEGVADLGVLPRAGGRPL